MVLRRVGFTPPYVGSIVSVGWGEAHPSWHKRLTWIYPVICVECNPRFMVQTFPMDLRKVGFTPPYDRNFQVLALNSRASRIASAVI